MRILILKIMVMTAFCSVYVLSINAQNDINIDKRLERGYDANFLLQLKEKSPSTLNLLTYNLDYSWFIAGNDLLTKLENIEYLYYNDEITHEKSNIKVEEIDLNNVNIQEYYFERQHDRHIFYKVGNTGIIIGFYSALENAKRYNKYNSQ